ncbi:hypothetical protein BGZ95_002001 [Linnemannia exigua]|uniref:F-box domain-containing protein n=1 Tax=Linnemannia exigua TaxID=604196 RepID=A0AAD4D890_9FUNG|nr:hypothetical protein BGZ95_002001 [Linnemannia exigua]
MDNTYFNDPSPPPPACLPSSVTPLPPECLEIILGFLQNDLASLHNLLLVSRQFFQLTVRVLYKSPFRLAAIADSVSGGPHADNSASGRARFLERTKFLSRLLFQNLQIRPLTPSSLLSKPKASILDDSVDLGHIEPLLPPVENLVWPRQKPSLEAPSDWSSAINLAPTNNLYTEEIQHSEQKLQRFDPDADLMSFDDDWPLEDPNASSNDTNTSRFKGNDKTGLLMDYFYFYTHHDHRSISSVLNQIYPGAGRREYDKYMAEIEQAILQHNPKQIESIHIQTPSVVVPYLHAHMEQFELLSTIKLRDPVWTNQELEMVHAFLRDHAAIFPAARVQNSEDDDHRYDYSQERQQILSLRKGVHGRKAAIRHVNYSTSRSYGDDARLQGQLFDPLQLILALGPGLESIDSVYWLRTELSQLDALDVRSLRSLRIGYLTTPHADHSFSRPEFISRCRQLHSLDLFSSSGDMFLWAVQDWNNNKRALEPLKYSTSATNQEESLDPQLYPWLRDMNLSGPERVKARPLLPLRHLRIHGPTDRVVFDILRDALYSFRKTLHVLEAVSDIEYAAGGGEWLDHAEELLVGQSRSESKGKSNSSGYNKGKEQQQNPDSSTSRGRGMNDEDFYDTLPSIAAGSLFIRWEVPCLTNLDLTGPIATVFDVESLRYMPNLRNICFSIITYTGTSASRNRLYRPSRMSRADYRNSDIGTGEDESMPRRCDMTLLPVVTGPALRRVMIRGPWPEITDESLQRMIETSTRKEDMYRDLGRADADLGDNDDGDDNGRSGEIEDEEEDTWGNRLYELSIMDNPRVTVQGMTRLAQQMDQLQVMGMSLTLPAPSNSHHHFTDISHMHHYHRKSGGSRYKYMPQESNSVAGDADSTARKMVLKARIKMPWVDLGPEAKHLGRRIRPDGYLSRGWNI